MNTMVGSRKARAVSPRPRRLSRVMKSEDPQAERDGGPVQGGEGGLQRGHAGGDGDGDGERVVDDQRRGGDEAGVPPEVGAGDGVGPAAHRVGVDDLAVGEDEDGQESDDGDRDGQDEVQGTRAGHRQHEDDGLGSVGHRREGVERERRESLDGSDPFLARAPRRPRWADQQVPDGDGPVVAGICHGEALYEARLRQTGRARRPAGGPDRCRPGTA